jgi:hypothetical protein
MFCLKAVTRRARIPKIERCNAALQLPVNNCIAPLVCDPSNYINFKYILVTSNTLPYLNVYPILVSLFLHLPSRGTVVFIGPHWFLDTPFWHRTLRSTDSIPRPFTQLSFFVFLLFSDLVLQAPSYQRSTMFEGCHTTSSHTQNRALQCCLAVTGK